jgi:hypothetical protein
MSIRAYTKAIDGLATALDRVRAAPVKVDVTVKQPDDREAAIRRARLQDPREIEALRKRLKV